MISDMADGSAPEISSSQSLKVESRPSQFWKTIKAKFGRKGSEFSEKPGAQSQPDTEPEVKKPGIDQLIKQEIERKGLKPPAFKSEGASGFSGTNEKVKQETLKAVRESQHPPNGYIIGVGVPNLFSTFDVFPEGAKPKGIVMVNTDPFTVQQTKVFLKGLKEGKIIDFSSREPQVVYDETSKNPSLPNDYDGYNDGSNNVDTYAVIRRHIDTLIDLARSDNIALIQQDILNPELLKILVELPGYKDSNNVVYLSNIADWAWRGEANRLLRSDRNFMIRALSNPYAQIPEDIDISTTFEGFENLKRISPGMGHETYFIDTLQRLKYVLRAGDKPPVFGRSDFNILAS